jgi:hypothetical protein
MSIVLKHCSVRIYYELLSTYATQQAGASSESIKLTCGIMFHDLLELLLVPLLNRQCPETHTKYVTRHGYAQYSRLTVTVGQYQHILIVMY